jgi:hypothetical protein
MTNLGDSIKYYELQIIKIRRKADEQVKEIEKHIAKLNKRLKAQTKDQKKN